jgi:transcriptional regulator GlxA family with amidase domain
MRTIAVLIFDRVPVFEMAVPCEVFGIDRSAMGVPNYRVLVCAGEPGPLRTSAGFRIETEHGLRALSRADTIIVPAWRDVNETPPEGLLEALRRAYRRGCRIASLCSGAFVLAAAGLLDGRRATTHWMFAQQLSHRFPRIKVDPEVLYVDEGQVLTSAGTAAGIDLCLHLVRRDYGAHVANVFARRMVVPPHREGGQAQYIEAPVATTTEGNPLQDVMSWALTNLGEPLTVAAMAKHARVPGRTFARHFRAVTGTTPLRWLHVQRIAAAQRMLETTDASIETIAECCGFGAPANFRFHFARAVSTTPTHYRRVFRPEARSGGPAGFTTRSSVPNNKPLNGEYVRTRGLGGAAATSRG